MAIAYISPEKAINWTVATGKLRGLLCDGLLASVNYILFPFSDVQLNLSCEALAMNGFLPLVDRFQWPDRFLIPSVFTGLIPQ